MTDRLTDQPTDQQTDIRGQRRFEIPISMYECALHILSFLVYVGMLYVDVRNLLI